jgi:restriction system protein
MWSIESKAAMAKRSLFSLLSEQPWWVSLLVAMALFAAAQFVFPPVAPFVALPFAAIAIYFAWQQLRGISHATARERLAAVRAMPWEAFAVVVSDAYRRRGYVVEAVRNGAFDFKLSQRGRITLVQCRRWKVNQVGIGPVRELCDALDKHEAFNGVCIAAGEFSDAARQFAAGKPVVLLNGPALAELVGSTRKKGRRWFGR